jgi:SAM-dependent methyltransferase
LKSINEGHFARKQVFSKDWLISWSHSRRFHLGLLLARQFAGKRVLDYGCGDGTFLAMLMAQSEGPAAATGAELVPETVAECRKRLGDDGLNFVPQDQLEHDEHRGAFDAIICMEVLEHVVDVGAVFDRFVCLLAPAGKIIISVPVETGLPLLIKQAVRRIAGWRGIGDYPGTTSYTVGEFAKSVFATGHEQHIVRPIHKNPDGRAFHDHKGFNWMALRRQIAERFDIERTVASPVRWLSPHLGSQVWFIASRKSDDETSS